MVRNPEVVKGVGQVGTSSAHGTAGVLRMLRLRAGLSQQDLAARAGMSVRAVRYLESGQVARPRAASLHRLAAALCVEVDTLVGVLDTASGPVSPRPVRTQIGVLGPLRVWHDDAEQPLEAPMQRLLLGLLATQPRRTVGVAEIVDVLWSDSPPATAAQLVQTYVGQVRRLVEPDRRDGAPWRVLRRESGGYRLDADGLDLADCLDLAARARQAWTDGLAEPAYQCYREAWSCWRGPVLLGLPSRLREHPAVSAVARLRVTILIEWADVAFALGQYDELVEPLRMVCDEEPLHEGLAARLMLALAGGGRQSAALALFERVRERLDDDLGVAPGTELRAAHLRILRGQLRSPSGMTDGPAMVARQLPTEVTCFVGRTGHLRELDAMLGQHGARGPAVMIAGMGGVGKTALAVHWAYSVRDRFPGGQLHLDLRGHSVDPPLRPLEALAQLLHGLGVPAERIPGDEPRAAALYRSQLARRPVLVLLDNAADATQVRPLLPGGDGSLAVVTSREELGGLIAREGARLVRLEALGEAESHALLTEMLGARRTDGEPAAVAELTRLCAYLPLALRIAAANLTTRPGHRIADYVTRLARDPLAALSIPGDATTAIRATFRLSVDALSAGERRMFRSLGLTAGPDIALETLAALLGMSADAARRSMDVLVARALVTEPSPGRYVLHDLLRCYAAELAAEEEDRAERDAALTRLAGHYRTAVAAAADILYPHLLRMPDAGNAAPTRFAGKDAALTWFEAEAANLVALVVALNAQGHYTEAWEIAHLSNGYFLLRMDSATWQSLVTAAAVAAEAAGGPFEQAMAHLQSGMVMATPGQSAESARHNARAAELARAAGWVECEAVALNNLSRCHWTAGRVEDTIHQLTEALVLHRRAGRQAGEAVTLANLAAAYAERSRDESGLARRASLVHAKTLLDQALTLHRAIGDRRNEAETLRVLAEAHRDLEDLAPAHTLSVLALGMAQDSADTRAEIGALSTLATVLARQGNASEALRYHERALHLAEAKDQPYLQAQVLLDQADSLLRLGKPDSALLAVQDALVLGRLAGSALFELRGRRLLARIPSAVNPHAPRDTRVARRPTSDGRVRTTRGSG